MFGFSKKEKKAAAGVKKLDELCQGLLPTLREMNSALNKPSGTAIISCRHIHGGQCTKLRRPCTFDMDASSVSCPHWEKWVAK